MGRARDVGASMKRDATLGPLLMGPLDVLGVESLEGGAATLRVRFKVPPLDVGRVV